METESLTPELATLRDQIGLWSSEITLIHEDIRGLEQNIISTGGLLVSTLILSAGLFLSFGAKDSNSANTFVGLLPFLCILLSVIGNMFLVVTSYLGFGIIRADIYIRYLNKVSKEKLGIRMSGWEDWKHRQQGDLSSPIERVFYSLGHGLFVLFTCVMALSLAAVGLALFVVVDKSSLKDSLVTIAWGGFSFALIAFLCAVLFFALTCWITLVRVYRH